MGTQTQTTSDIREEIRNANDEFENLFKKGDAAGMSKLYTTDGMLLPTGAGIQKGTESIRNFWQMVMSLGIKAAKLDTTDVEQIDDTAIEVGQYELSGGDGNRIDQGKYVVVWKREEGAWKLDKDIWNTNLSNS